MSMNLNQQPNKISDFDLLTELDVCCKQSAVQLTTGILESSNPQVRQMLMGALQNAFQQQQMLAQLMMQKGYYRPLPASPEMIQVAREQMEMANAQVGGPQGVQPNIAPPLTGTGPVPPQV